MTRDHHDVAPTAELAEHCFFGGTVSEYLMSNESSVYETRKIDGQGS